MAKRKPKPSRNPFDAGGPLSNLPDIAKIAAWVGFPAAAAAFLIWFITSGQAAKLDKIDMLLRAQETQFALVAQHLQDETNQSWIIVGLMQRVCINTSKTQDERIACVTSQRGGK